MQLQGLVSPFDSAEFGAKSGHFVSIFTHSKQSSALSRIVDHQAETQAIAIRLACVSQVL